MDVVRFFISSKTWKGEKKIHTNMQNQVSLLLLLTRENNIAINVAVGNCNFVSLNHAHSLCWRVSLYLLIRTAVELKDQGFWDPTAATNTGSSGRTPVKPVQAMYDLPLNQAYLARKESVEHILNSCPTALEPCRSNQESQVCQQTQWADMAGWGRLVQCDLLE